MSCDTGDGELFGSRGKIEVEDETGVCRLGMRSVQGTVRHLIRLRWPLCHGDHRM